MGCGCINGTAAAPTAGQARRRGGRRPGEVPGGFRERLAGGPRIFSSLGGKRPITVVDPGPLPLEGITLKKPKGSTMSRKRGAPNKEEWLREAEKAYEKVFGQRDKLGEGRRPMTFTEIESEAVQEGNKLARWLLEGKISTEAEAADCHAEECNCPVCKRPAKRRSEDLETRDVHARPGAVSFERYGYYCVPCRRLFFSGGPQAQPED